MPTLTTSSGERDVPNPERESVNLPRASDNTRHDAGAFPGRGASSDNHDGLNGIARQSSLDILKTVFEYKLNSLAQARLGLLNRLALAIGTRHLGANSPVTAFGGFFDNRSKLAFHGARMRLETKAVNHVRSSSNAVPSVVAHQMGARIGCAPGGC